MEHNPTVCPGCGKGHIVWNGGADNFFFTCSRAPKCRWECGRGGDIPGGGLKGLVGIALNGGKVRVPKAKPKKKHTKRVEFVPDSPEFRQALREEIQRRMDILIAEREKFPPTLIKKGKRLVSNPKFTNKMRDHMHTFYVDAAEIREEMLHA